MLLNIALCIVDIHSFKTSLKVSKAILTGRR